ncbi:MAG: 4Fe-4S dicluster domain-containing protein [Deltaproteobacteria bacterium]|nr:4Fe-4S dicluster domain-containing protein [Deltaproteobacteria bacterium]
MDETLKPLETKTLAEKLYLVRFKVDSTSHLAVDDKACQECTARSCLFICPTEVYRWDEAASRVIVSYEGCLECGACRVACDANVLVWNNPAGGFGVCYRYG